VGVAFLATQRSPALLDAYRAGVFRTLLGGAGNVLVIVVRRFRSTLNHLHGVKNGLDDGIISNGGVDHHVVEGARRPVSVKVMFDEGDALAIHRIDILFGL
jgi:hypothetical protein